MGTPFVGELRIMSFSFAPKGWALCNGQLMPINQNQALFSLLGTMYGGDGRVTFALPDLRGRVPVHMGGGSFTTEGQQSGQPSTTLTITTLPTHNHIAQGAQVNGDTNIGGITPGPTKAVAQGLVSLQNNATTPAQMYSSGPASGTMAPTAIGNTGGSQPHENRQPFLVLNICIALNGIFPSRN